MRNFCTLFDSNYLIRGLALYYSLQKTEVEFNIYIYAFDDTAYDILKKLNLQGATIISLEEFEDKDLLAIKHLRSKGEYCWTCTPAIILHSINKYNLSDCVYLDADIYFFSSPEVLFSEVENNGKDVMITEHRYTDEYNQESTSGKYCVQFMYFKNSEKGMEVLNWWRERCLEWCYSRFEDGKFGDQKYLDDWLERFNCVHSLENLGGGVAPWNVQQYKVLLEDNELKIISKKTYENKKLVFYHFHGLKLYENFVNYGKSYVLDKNVKKYIYNKYLDDVKKISNSLEEKFPNLKLDLIKLALSGKIKLILQNFKIVLGRYLKKYSG